MVQGVFLNKRVLEFLGTCQTDWKRPSAHLVATMAENCAPWFHAQVSPNGQPKATVLSSSLYSWQSPRTNIALILYPFFPKSYTLPTLKPSLKVWTSSICSTIQQQCFAGKSSCRCGLLSLHCSACVSYGFRVRYRRRSCHNCPAQGHVATLPHGLCRQIHAATVLVPYRQICVVRYLS